MLGRAQAGALLDALLLDATSAAFIGGNAMASWGYTNGVCVCHDTRRRTHTVCVCMTHATALTRRSLWLWRARGAAAIVVPQIACTPPCVQSSFPLRCTNLC